MASSWICRVAAAPGPTSAAARASVVLSMASSHTASAGSKSSTKSAAKSRVSGVPGSRRFCSRVTSSPAKDSRAPKPRSA